jgi:hypothetical protein
VVTPEPGPAPLLAPPVSSIDEAIAQMQQIDAALPASDGVACFNRMYLDVTQQVNDHVTAGFFADAAFVARLDVVFANIYFAAVNAAAESPSALPPAWAPLIESRHNGEIYSIQFALAGMNAHINHDLPLAVVRTCTDLGAAPDSGSHPADYQKVDSLLDAAEASIRQSFESSVIREVDQRGQAVLNLVCNWSINSARDAAWDTALGLWAARDLPAVTDLIMGALARTVAMASRCLLVTF